MARPNRFGVKGLFLAQTGVYRIDLRGYRINSKIEVRRRFQLPRGLSEADAIAYAREYLGRFQLSMAQPRDMVGVKGPRGKGHVYFIACGEYVKVGFTSSDPATRLRAVDTHNAIQPRIIALVKGTHKTEREWQARLAEHRVRREWFWLAPCLAVLRAELGVDAQEAAE